MKQKKIPYDSKLLIRLTLRERNLIRNKTFYDFEFAKCAIVDAKGIKVHLSLDDIEYMQGFIAAEANHTKNKKLQRELDLLFKKLQVYLDSYDDQDE